MTLEEIKVMSAAEVAECLAKYNKWVNGEPPYQFGMYNHPFSRCEIGSIIKRAIELLKEANNG